MSGDSECAQAGDDVRRPGPAVLVGPRRRGAAGRPKYGPRLDRTKMLDRNPNTPPDGLVGVISSTVGVAGVVPKRCRRLVAEMSRSPPAPTGPS
jgi:hypothetical protein